MDEKWNYINEYEFVKRSLQFVFLISVFCLFAWLFSSGFYMPPPQSFFNASTCFFSMLANTLERKYMFLICNLILVFLANTFDDDLEHHHSPPSPFNDIYYTKMKLDPPILVKDAEAEEQYGSTLQVTPVEAPPIEGEEEVVEDDDDDDDDKEGEEDELEVTVKGDEEVGDKTMATNYELEMASTEELNRKFEEFIRRMKKEIRIEPQRHPIAV